MDTPKKEPAPFTAPSEETSFAAVASRMRKPQRRLRRIFVMLVIVFGVFLGLIGAAMWQEQRQKEAAIALWESGDAKTRTTRWLKYVLRKMPSDRHVLLVTFEDWQEGKEHWAIFSATGFESVPDGYLDPTSPNYMQPLWLGGSYPGVDRRFRFSEHPDVDWRALLESVAQDPEIVSCIEERNIQLDIAELVSKPFDP